MARSRLLVEGLEDRILLNGLPDSTEAFITALDNATVNYPVGSAGAFSLPQFDTQGGTRTLRSVQLKIIAGAVDGRMTVDSESAVAGTASAGLGVSVRVVSSTVPSVLDVTAAPSQSEWGALAADDEVGAADFAGPDSLTVQYALVSATQTHTLTAGVDDLSPFIGTGGVAFAFTSALIADHTADVAPVEVDRTDPRFNFTAVVTYSYTPATLPNTQSFTRVVDNSGLNYPAGAAGTFWLPQFDDLGGRRILQAVQWQATNYAYDGAHLLDSEDPANPGTASVTIGAEIAVAGQPPIPFSSTSMLAESLVNQPIAVDDEPGPPDFAGSDSLIVSFVEKTDTQTDSLAAPGDDLTPFIGTGQIDFDFTSESEATHQEDVGPVQTVAIPPVFRIVATITYVYENVPPPEFDIIKGVVAEASPTGVFSPRVVGPVSFTPPGSLGLRFVPASNPGAINSTNLDIRPVDSDFYRATPGSLISFCIVLENVGGGNQGAFDVRVTDTIPYGFLIPTGPQYPLGLNLYVSDGTGAAINYVRTGGGVFQPSDFFLPGPGIELVDPGPTAGPGQLGAVDPFHPTSGRNVVVITYDLLLDPALGEATLVNWASLTNAAWGDGEPDLVEPDLTDPALVTTIVPTPYVYNVWFGSLRRELEAWPRTTWPMYSGTAEPGSTLAVSLYNSRGDLIGYEAVVVDAGGNWLAGMRGVEIDDLPATITIQQAYPGYSALADAGYNLRTYFSPAIQGGLFTSEALTVQNVCGKRTAYASVNALYEASAHPIVLGWHGYPYEYLAVSAVPGGQ